VRLLVLLILVLLAAPVHAEEMVRIAIVDGADQINWPARISRCGSSESARSIRRLPAAGRSFS
jgi:hypothetical protein